MIHVKQHILPTRGMYYSEIHSVYIYTPLIAFKTRLIHCVFLFFSDIKYMYMVHVSIRHVILHTGDIWQYYKRSYNFIGSLIGYLLRSATYGSSSRFRLYGRGYKALPFLHTYLFKLGYPYVLFYTLPLNIKLKKKKKRHFFQRFIGIWPHEVKLYLSNIKSLRIPDVYCSKGIFKKSEYFVKKEGKKAFVL